MSLEEEIRSAKEQLRGKSKTPASPWVSIQGGRVPRRPTVKTAQKTPKNMKTLRRSAPNT